MKMNCHAGIPKNHPVIACFSINKGFAHETISLFQETQQKEEEKNEKAKLIEVLVRMQKAGRWKKDSFSQDEK